MGPADAIKSCLARYVTFSGRASRSEFWWFWGTMTLVLCACSFVGLESLGSLIWLGTILPVLAVAWRRMHDSGRSGALLLLPAATMIVSVYVAMFAALRPISERLAKLPITPETTLREMQELQTKALDGIELGDSLPYSPLALAVFGIGALWMIYLLTRPSFPHPNSYGPPPTEVTQ
jgi:uncharacterized membrane protein YhaH (DUF805 family)